MKVDIEEVGLLNGLNLDMIFLYIFGLEIGLNL